MLRLKHSPDNNWTRYGDLSLSGASGDGPPMEEREFPKSYNGLYWLTMADAFF